MSFEVKCPYNSEAKMNGDSLDTSVFTVKAPFQINSIADHSFAVVEKLSAIYAPVTKKQYDEFGNYIYTDYVKDIEGNQVFDDTKSLSAVGYEFRFPQSRKDSEVRSNCSSVNTSVGWFGHWGVNQNTLNYTIGNNWSFTVRGLNDIPQPVSTDIEEFSTCSGKCGLNSNSDIYIFNLAGTVPGMSEIGKQLLLLRSDNNFFDLLSTGPLFDYLKVDDTYFIGHPEILPELQPTYYHSKLYNATEERNALAIAAGLSSYPSVYTKYYYTLAEIERDFGVNFTNIDTYKDKNGEYKFSWRLYGIYEQNGENKYFELNTELQKSINEYLLALQLKQKFSNFRDLIISAIENTSDIIVSNVKYANLVISNKEDTRRIVIADTIVLCSKTNEMVLPNKTTNQELKFSSPNLVSKPEFLVNNTFLMDFPCYKFFGDTIRNLTKDNFAYDELANVSRFDLIVDGLAPQDIEISADTEFNIVAEKTNYLVPPVFDQSSSYADCRTVVDVTNSAFGVVPLNRNVGKNILTLSPTNNFFGNSDIKFGNYENKLTLGSRYPMTQIGSVKFITRTVFTIEVPGETINQVFTVKSKSLAYQKTVAIKFNRLKSVTSVSKLSNTISRTIGNVTLSPYMYDCAKIKVQYEMSDGKEIEISNSDVTITIYDNTGAGKHCNNVKLSDIVNGTYGDLIFSSGLVKNSSTKEYELILYIASTCSNSIFSGLGFNDSSVLVIFNIKDEYKQKYNLIDSNYAVNYITSLMPYLIQGTPFTKTPLEEVVLNSGVSPSNVSARVDYNYYSYSDNSYGFVNNNLFTNAEPKYYVTASAFIPTNFTGELTNISAEMRNKFTNERTPINFQSADCGENSYLVLTSATADGYTSSKTVNSGFANCNLWTFEQELDVSAKKLKKETVMNSLMISAHLSYSSIIDNNGTSNMVTIRSTI